MSVLAQVCSILFMVWAACGVWGLYKFVTQPSIQKRLQRRSREPLASVLGYAIYLFAVGICLGESLNSSSSILLWVLAVVLVAFALCVFCIGFYAIGNYRNEAFFLHCLRQLLRVPTSTP
jgi:hypothetical protein